MPVVFELIKIGMTSLLLPNSTIISFKLRANGIRIISFIFMRAQNTLEVSLRMSRLGRDGSGGGGGITI